MTPDRKELLANRAARHLALLLRLAGWVLLLAWPFVFIPEEWMAASHRGLGLGEFPASPLVDYLTRSASLLYGIHGAIYLALATDVPRFLPILRVLAMLTLLAGALLIGIDLHAGLPRYWILAEGPPLLVLGGLMLFLVGRAEATDESGGF